MMRNKREIMNTDKIAVSIRQQAQIAIAEADVILFVCDARAGITHEDAEVAKMLRQSKKPIVLALINKQILQFSTYSHPA